MKDSGTNHIYPLLLSSNGIKGSTLSHPDSANAPARKEKKKECFEWKKHYPSPNKFYLILFSNIQQYQQTVYLKLSVSEVLVLEQLHLSGNI